MPEVESYSEAVHRNPLWWVPVLGFCIALAPAVLSAQSTPAAHNITNQQKSNGQIQQAPPEAGGPQIDSGPYAIPKVSTNTQEKPAPPPAPRPTEGMPSYAITVDVPLVTVDALVLTKDGQFIPGLEKQYFRVLEDNVVQPIQSFGLTKAGFTAVLLVEFASTPAFQASRRQFLYDALRASYAFTDQMQKNDYVALVQYDIKPSILVDFTSNKEAVRSALDTMRIPGFSETNMYDALYDTLDRLDRVEGRKEVILIGSGLDSFSRISYDKLLKKIKATQNVTIYTISTGFLWRTFMESRMSMSASLRNMDFLQGDNQMSTFARMTGGRWFSPRFEAELPEDYREIAAAVRNQYTIAYRPTNAKRDGTYRKLKVELVQPGTDKPLIIRNQKGKELKYQVLTRDGYTARHEVE
ncbi:MAG: VWA domain-containing protein [Acidobacteria bacterium]|nr:MAG: VWA domain-containing protein [Acidobacteriota bacterium]